MVAGVIAQQNKECAPFDEARLFVRSLNLKVGWRAFCKSGDRPINIPSDSERISKDQGCAGFGVWRGEQLDLYLVTKWSHVLSVVPCRIVLLVSNYLTDDTKRHGTTGINIRAE